MQFARRNANFFLRVKTLSFVLQGAVVVPGLLIATIILS
jgi:hypothetical protein